MITAFQHERMRLREHLELKLECQYGLLDRIHERNLLEHENIEKLAELNEQMAHARRINADHQAIKNEILAVQEQIETIRKSAPKKWRFL